jgi:hypothetical protein
MNYKTRVLGAASVFALLAGTAPATAGQQEGTPDTTVSSRFVAGAQSDPLLDFMTSAKRGLSVEDAITEIFADASRERIESVPQFLAGIEDLGLGSDTVERSRVVLAELVSSSGAVDDAAKLLIFAQLQEGECTPELAAQGRCRPREPETTGTVDPGAAEGGIYR